MRTYELGDRVKVIWSYYNEYEIGILDRYIESDDEPGYWLINDYGEEVEILFHDLFRGDAKIEILERKS